jgi:predicted nucleic acid-binding protein
MARRASGETFLDTGIFVAWLVERDALHAQADALFDRLSGRLVTSLAVVSEAYSHLLHEVDEEAARRFRQALAALPRLTLLPIGVEHHRAVEKKLDALRGLKLTYVDASCLVFIAERKIHTVWGTDRDLGCEGASVIPGPP